jgi:hypothetical protein
MYCPMNKAEALVDHKKATAKTAKSKRTPRLPSGIILNKSTKTAAMVMGNTQYPRTQTD